MNTTRTAAGRGNDRVLITNCLAMLGGGEIALLRHLDHSTLDRRRLAVALLNDGPLAQAVRERGVRCEVVGRAGRDGFYPGAGERLQIAWRLARLVRELHAGCFVCYTVPDLQAAMMARRFTSARLCWRSQGETTVHRNAADSAPRLQRFVRRVRRNVDLVVTTTHWDRERLIQLGANPNSVRTSYLGLEEDWFRAHEIPEAGGRSTCRVAMCGRLVRWKGHVTFLRAFAQAATSRLGAEAWIIGDGDPGYRAALEREAADLGIGERVRFWGHRDEVAALLRMSDVAVHCSDREPFGQVVVEAMACGLPVIASDVSGPREIVSHNETGLLVAPGAVGALAETLGRLMDNPGERRRLGSAGQREAFGRFRAAVNVPAMEHMILAGLNVPDSTRSPAEASCR